MVVRCTPYKRREAGERCHIVYGLVNNDAAERGQWQKNTNKFAYVKKKQ